MAVALETHNLSKRYGRRWALRDCTLQVPTGSVAGLVGLNGAGKTTLMRLAAGLIEADAGSIQVLGSLPSQTSANLLARIGFVAQERPLYRHFSINELLTLGQKLNPDWDDRLAREFLQRLEIPLSRHVDKLSGGQQAQVSLVMTLAKKPELLLLDEPFANVDPLARREFMKILMETVATREVSVLLSSHIVTDLDQVCDYLIILSSAHVQLADNIDDIVRSHKLLIGPRASFESIANSHTVLRASHSGRQSTLLVRTNGPVHPPSWQVQDVSLEEIVLAYLAVRDTGLREQTQSKQEVLP